MAPALEQAQSLHQTALQVLIPHVQELATVNEWQEQISAYADEKGFEAGPHALTTVASQAALLLVLRLLRARLIGVDIEDVLHDNSISEAMRTLYERESSPMTLLDEILLSCDVSVDINTESLADEMAAQPYQDAIGDIFQAVVPQAERRKLGQFWTPQPIAEFMARWILPEAGRVWDPASGSGALLLPAISRLQQLGVPENELDQLIFANDVDELVHSLMLATLSAYHHMPWEHVLLEDALTAEHQTQFEAITCNPPYTRHHHLGAAYKTTLRRRITEQRGIEINGFTSLFAYFFLVALSRLSPTGRMAFITPGELYDANYAKPIKQHVLESVNLRAVIYFGSEIKAFAGVDTTGAISLVDGGICDHAPITFIELSDWPGQETLLATLLATFDNPTATTRTYPWGIVEQRERGQLASGKWLVPHIHRRAVNPRLVPLKSLARVMRGIATGNNNFFTLTEAERQAHHLDRTVLKPVLVKTRDSQQLSVTDHDIQRLATAGKKVWLLYIDQVYEELSSESQAYIDYGVEQEVDQGKLVSLRKYWYQTERRTAPTFLYTYLANGAPRFVYNQTKAHNLNAFHSVAAITEIAEDQELTLAFAAILNAQLTLGGLRAIGRSYGGNTLKIEPSELGELPVLDPRELPTALRHELGQLFITSAHMTSREFEPVRVEIDRLLEAYLDQ